MYEHLIFNKDFGEYEYLYGDNFTDALENYDLTKEYNKGRLIYIKKRYIDIDEEEEE